MPKTMQVQVPKPCHENWDEMTNTDKGRFCLSCRKEVIDFSIMADQQILYHISKATGGVCGRFNNEQLNRDMELRNKRKLSWYKYLIHVMIPALLMANKSSAQEKITGDTIVCSTPKDVSQRLTGKIAVREEIKIYQTKIIEGKITDVKLQPIQGAAINIKGKRIGVVSDNNGFFKITVDKDIVMPILVASCVGYEQKEFRIDLSNTKENSITVPILLKESTMGLGEIVVVGYAIVRKKEKRALLEPVKDSISNFFSKDMVSVYPNPVPAGSAFNIDFNVKDAGEYDIMIANISGQPLMKKKISLDSKKQIVPIACDHKMTTGIYFVQVVSRSGKKNYLNKIVVL